MNGIILIGFMGAGKTTVGQLLAQKTGMPHIDFDELIREEIGMSIQDYFHQFGEEAFREKETAILKQYINQHRIISTGGGIVIRPENRLLLKATTGVVYLKTQPKNFLARLKNDHENIRPLVVSKSSDEIKKVFEPRIPLYEECANFIIQTDDRTPEEIATEIVDKLK